ncbi:Metaxin-2 [Clarias magur]|uniref:Metaxin-2 n=1 Tax=Clarias magur TaxID=1594786 RepID=A0A8J4XEF5_CLAMG|nr:Metaxin-2 [Clarias magur]
MLKSPEESDGLESDQRSRCVTLPDVPEWVSAESALHLSLPLTPPSQFDPAVLHGAFRHSQTQKCPPDVQEKALTCSSMPAFCQQSRCEEFMGRSEGKTFLWRCVA